MAAGIILAGGASTRMPGDKAFMEVAGRRVIDIQLEVIRGLFERVLIVVNAGRTGEFEGYASPGVEVAEEPVAGRGPLGGILSGLMLSGAEENFVLACDMPFVQRDAIEYVLSRLAGFQVAVPRSPGGLEPLHAAYHSSCRPVIEEQLAGGSLKVTGFFGRVSVREIPWEEMRGFDPSGRMLLNLNSPQDMKRAAGARARGAPGSRLVVLGDAAADVLAGYLRERLPGPGGPEVERGGAPGEDILFTALLLDRPLSAPFEGPGPDVVLVDRGPGFIEGGEPGLEAWLKAATGAGKVLIYEGERGRARAFEKVLDMALSRIPGGAMPEEIPEKVVEAVKAGASDGRMSCERARELASELGVPIPVVGRALDLLDIKIISCELGCF